LRALKEAGIPVVVIEGNHDMRDTGAEHSWLRSLSAWGYLKLLEPIYDEAGNMQLSAWNEEAGRGAYIDIAGARIFGSNWYGASAQHAIPRLADALRDARDPNLFNILLLHTDVEGQLNRQVITAIPVAKLNELKQTVDYLALGHTHKRFVLDNWAFNPGSLEACSIDEFSEERGAFLVEVDAAKNVSASLLREYHQRPFDRLAYDVSGAVDAEAVYAGVLDTVEREAKRRDEASDAPAPIVEMTLRGHLGFKNSLLPLKKMREEIRERTGALHVHIRNHSVPIEYAVSAGLDEQAPRHQRERHIIEGLVMQDNRFKHRAADMAELIIEVKRQALSGEDKTARADKIYELIEQKMAAPDGEQQETPAQLALERNATV
jgi:DNA repair exonuclease SbcCD nuclease subunit